MKDRIIGKAEELKGRLTGNKAEELKGRARQGVGNVKQAGKELAYDAEHPDTEAERAAEATGGDAGQQVAGGEAVDSPLRVFQQRSEPV
jgi:uncharacterized protein YjbJ (UPF0337 family)